MLSSSLTQFAQACSSVQEVSLGIPTWYEGLSCDANGVPTVAELSDLWVVGVNIVDIVLFVTSVASVFFLIYGGIQYIVSQGQPDKLTAARRTLTYAIVGLIVAILARAIVQFIAMNIFGASSVETGG